MPLGALLRGFGQDPVTDLDDQPALFGHGNERGRRQQPACRVNPADQRFEPAHAPGLGVDLRLVQQAELALLQRRADLVFQIQPI